MSKIEELLQQVCKEHCAFYGNGACNRVKRHEYCGKALAWEVDCEHIVPEEKKIYTLTDVCETCKHYDWFKSHCNKHDKRVYDLSEACNDYTYRNAHLDNK